jgi:hypothetical protein
MNHPRPARSFIQEAAPRATRDLHRKVRHRLDRDEVLDLLASVSSGRIVFTCDALPTVRPVDHILDDGRIVVCSGGSDALVLRARSAGGGGVVVVYEAGAFDSETCRGWSAVVTGYAELVTDSECAAFYQALLAPRMGELEGQAVCIRPDLITGFRIGAAPDSDAIGVDPPESPGSR